MLKKIHMASSAQDNLLYIRSGTHRGWLKTIVYDASISMVGQISSLLLAAILQFMIARSLGAAMSGSIALGMSLMTFFANLSLIGLDKGIVRFFPAYKSEPSKQINLVIVSGLITLSISLLFVVLFWLRPHLIVDLFSKQDLLLEALPYFLFLIPGNAMITYLTAVTQALKKFNYQVFFVQFLLPLFKISALIWVVYEMSKDVKTVVSGLVITTMLVIFLLGIALWRFLQPLQITLSVRVALKSLIVFSMPLFFVTIIDYGWSEAQILILGALVLSDQIGIFNVALRLALVLTVFQTGFGTVFAPVIAELHHVSDLAELSRLLKVITRWSTSITMPFFLVMLCFAGDIMRIFGNEFITGRFVLQMLAVAIFLNVAVGPIGWFIVLTGRSYLSLINSCIALVVNISVTFSLTTKFGIVGAALAMLLGILVVNLMRLIQIRFIFGIHPFSAAMWKSLVSGCLVFLLGTSLGHLEWISFFPLTVLGILVKLVFCAMFITTVYMFLLCLFRLDESDKEIFRGIRILKFFHRDKQLI